ATPLKIVPKKSKNAAGEYELRAVCDLRKINSSTVADLMVLPSITEMIESLRGAQIFTAMDLTSAFWSVEVDDASKPYTAFVCHSGQYVWNRMPQGAKNSPATMARIGTILLSGLQEYALIFIDDILVFSKDFESHLKHLDAILTRIADHGLKLKPSKSFFAVPQVLYLGHILSAEGIRCDGEKLKAIRELK